MAPRAQLGFPALWPLRHPAFPRPSWTWAVVATAVAVEVAGRGSPTDVHDSVALLVLGAVVTLGWLVHGRDAYPWARGLGRMLRGAAARFAGGRIETGLDLRGVPPLPRRWPAGVRRGLTAAIVAVSVLVASAAVLDLEARALAVQAAYVPWVLVLGALWFALVAATATAAFFVICCAHDVLLAVHGSASPDMVRRWISLVLVWFAAVFAAGAYLPLWTPLLAAVGGVVLLLVTFTRQTGPDMTLVWRQRHGGPVHAMSWRAFESARWSGLVLGFLPLPLLALGPAALGARAATAETSMPVTLLLGSISAWIGGAAIGSFAVLACVWLVRQRRRDPAQPRPTLVHVRAEGVEEDTVREALAGAGLSLRFAPEPPDQEDVALEVVAEPPEGGRPGWPPRATPRALALPELRDALRRRDEVQRRRRIVRGFERLFRHAVGRRFRRGHGFLMAPHLWFVAGMSRDVDEDGRSSGEAPLPNGMVGPPYHRVFPPRARQHLHRLLRDAGVDLIFVEDGVGFRRFRRVLRLLFEHVDIHGTRMRVEDQHFAGVPGTRVMLHDYEIGNPVRAEGYPSPDFDTLGRARVMHVFRDRGGRPARTEVPADRTGQPVAV